VVAVDDQDLPVVALVDARDVEGRTERRERVELADLAAARDDRLPDALCDRERGDGVVDYAHGDALLRFAREGFA
jgi:hypothetical protein